MEVLACTDGKGGTGKSTFAILLSYKLIEEGKKVVLCDLDVECPNDFLLLKQELKNPEFIYQEFPKLNKEKCKKCGTCAKVCRSNAVFWVKNNYPIFIKELCSACGACWLVCPFKAIEKEEEKVGEVFFNQVQENFWLVTGRSYTKISETGPIVKEAKQKCFEFAKKVKADIMIIDTAAGTHCNVIHALMNVDKAYCITEPTPLGAYDLKLILELIKKLGVKAEIVLNKAGIGNERLIEEIGKAYGIKIGYRIPYSKEIIEAYSKGKLEEIKVI